MKSYGTSTTVFDFVFPDLVMGENTVLCPFHMEKTPSLQINTLEKIYHCFGCGRHGTENDFCMEYYKISRDQVSQFKELLFRSDSLIDYETFAKQGDMYKRNYTYLELTHMGIPESLLEELEVGCETKNELDTTTGMISIVPDAVSRRLVFPIIIKDRVIDHRAYTMDKTIVPKTKSDSGAPAGLILPYHLWIDDNRDTIICEGEKDMLFARAHGFNAISLGGCNNIPQMFLESFKDRTVYIVYDNDNPGKAGAIKLANALYSVTKNIYICNIGEYCPENKEDVTDFFVKYKHSNDTFIEMLEKATIFDSSIQEKFIKESYPEVSLNEASTVYLGKTVRSNVQVMATFEEQYSVPGYAMVSKVDQGGSKEKNLHNKGDVEYWSLNKHNFSDILVLTDNNLKEPQIKDNMRQIVGWGNEEGTVVKLSNYKTIFKASVADCTESVLAKDIKRTEFICYTDEKLEAGKNYQIIYKVVPHPYKGQQQVLIVLEVKESGDTVSTFEVTPAVIERLRHFQEYKFKELVEKQKAYIKFDVDNRLLEFIDLWYHTPKAFNFGYFKDIKGYLDGLIITESRVGKSTTAQELSKIYKLGAIASLAGSAATPAGLIGGSVKVGSSSQIRPGLIPRQHNKSIIFEELAKAKYSLIPELTDIRSSGLVRINRSTGDLTLPASVRILFLTNPKASEDGVVRPIMAYPNGVEIVKPLIPTPEDIARFDFIYILGETPKEIDPLWEPKEGMSEEDLQTRIRWVWSRTADEVILSKEITKLIVEESKKLNDEYQCSIKIFSSETWKKLARLSIAVASYMVSTDVSFKNIIVKESHVKIAVALLRSIYDNSIFKLKEFVNEERKTLDCSLSDINSIKETLIRFPSLMTYLENNNNIAKNTLYTISGLDIQLFNTLIQKLTNEHLITLSRDKIYCNPKLIIGIKKAREMLSSEGTKDETM
jgi:hypothetical protein